MIFGEGVSCRILYFDVSYLCMYAVADQLHVPRLGKRGLNCLLSFTCNNYVVSVRRCFLFLLVLGMGCVLLSWHSLGLPYNHFAKRVNSLSK